jgi:hypothetical protein
MIVRPGSPTSNAVAWREDMKAGSPRISRVHWWVQRVRYSDFDDADTSEVLNLATAFPQNPFPDDVFLSFSPFAYLDLREVFAASGLTDADFILGITGDTNGLVEVQAVETGQALGRKFAPGTLYTVATLDRAGSTELLLQLDTAGANIDALTSGIVDVYVPYILMPTSRSA